MSYAALAKEIIGNLRSDAGDEECPFDDPPALPVSDPVETFITEQLPTASLICRCGSTRWRDVTIHDGRSTRRDCATCGRFLCFPTWYGNPA